MVLQVLHHDSLLAPVVLYVISLSPKLSNFFFLSRPPKKYPLNSASSSLFISTLLIIIPTAVLLLAKHSWIFFLTFFVSFPLLSLSSIFWQIFSLFELSQMYLMWQRLGKGFQIDARVEIFNLLACSRSFPRSLALFGSYMWVIHASCFK